jgi:hypothetical protein
MSALASLRLFPSEQDEAQDAAENRRLKRSQRAGTQPRCASCGRFANEFWYDAICLNCMNDMRPVIVAKVDQARRWWRTVKLSPVR